MTRALDRLVRASVAIGMRVQPRKAFRQADQTLYASAVSREMVEAMRSAGQRLMATGVAVNGMTVIGWRRSESRIGLTIPGADLLQLGPSQLTSVASSTVVGTTGHDRVVSVVASGAAAAVWAHPPVLLALAASSRIPMGGPSELRERVGRIGFDGGGLDITVVADEGVLAIGDDPVGAVARLEAAERLAVIEREASR